MATGPAWPVTASADHGGGRHDRCQAAAGGSREGEVGEDCPATAVAAASAIPAATASPRLPAAAPSAPAVATPPAARTLRTPAGADLRTSLLGAAALAALAVLVVSGFGARRRLRHGWNDGGKGGA